MKQKTILAMVATAILMAACNSGRNNPADLQHKIDSVVALEKARQLRLQGIQLEDANPLQAFFDSLAILPLPVSYSEELVTLCPNFQPVELAFATVMGFDERVTPRAISLPESVGVRLILLAVSENEGEERHSLWLYSLGTEYFPVDKLLIYDAKTPVARLGEEETQTLFSITSDYEILVTTYTADHRRQTIAVYHLDPSRHFVKSRVLESKGGRGRGSR